MKPLARSLAALLAISSLMMPTIPAFADGAVAAPTPLPVTVDTETADALAALEARFTQAQFTKNPGACLALLKSIIGSPDVTAELVADVMDFAWDSDYVDIEDIIDLMMSVQSLGRSDLSEQYSSLTYALIITGRMDEAIAIQREEIARNPEVSDNYLYLIDMLNASGGAYDEAAELAEEALMRFPDQAGLWQSYAESLDGLYRYDEAVDAIKESLTLIKDADKDYDLTYTYGMLYSEQSRAGRYEDAARSLEHALSGSQSPDFFLERANFNLWKRYNPEAALKDLNSLTKRYPDSADALRQRVFAYLWLDRFDDAFTDAEALGALNGEAVGDRMSAIVAYYASEATGDVARADELFDAYLDDYPDDGVAWLYRAMMELYANDDPDATARSIDAATQQLGSDGDVLTTQGDLYRRIGLWSQAAKAYQEAADLTYDSPIPLNNLGTLLSQCGQIDLAQDVLARAEKEYPNHYWTLCLKMTVEAAAGDYADALATYDSIAKQFPFMAERSLMYIRVALGALAGRTEEAQAWLDELTPKDAVEFLSALECKALLGEYTHDVAAAYEAAEDQFPLGIDEMTPTKRRDTRITIALVQAEIAHLQGDDAACLTALREACGEGWFPEEVRGNWILKDIAGSDGYEQLREEFPVE